MVVGSSPTVGVLSKSGGLCIAEEAFLRAMMMKITRKKQNTHRGARTHDHEVKGLALYRLS